MGEKTGIEIYCLTLSTAVESRAACTVESIALAASPATFAAESAAASIAVLSMVVPVESELLEQAIIIAAEAIVKTIFLIVV